MPKYSTASREITLPTREKLKIIASARQPTSTILQLNLETGLRPVELQNLGVQDFDLDTKTVHPLTAKKGQARTIPVTNALAMLIQNHIAKHQLKLNDKLFKGTADYYAKVYRKVRAKLAEKLNDPSINKIKLYDFRHYFCSKKLRH